MHQNKASYAALTCSKLLSTQDPNVLKKAWKFARVAARENQLLHPETWTGWHELDEQKWGQVLELVSKEEWESILSDPLERGALLLSFTVSVAHLKKLIEKGLSKDTLVGNHRYLGRRERTVWMHPVWALACFSVQQPYTQIHHLIEAGFEPPTKASWDTQIRGAEAQLLDIKEPTPFHFLAQRDRYLLATNAVDEAILQKVVAWLAPEFIHETNRLGDDALKTSIKNYATKNIKALLLSGASLDSVNEKQQTAWDLFQLKKEELHKYSQTLQTAWAEFQTIEPLITALSERKVLGEVSLPNEVSASKTVSLATKRL